MDSRVKSALIGLPIFFLITLLGNKYLVDISLAVVAILAIKEYFNALGIKNKFLKSIGYIVSALISLVHLVSTNVLMYIIVIGSPIVLTLLFAIIVGSDLKVSVKSMMETFFGIAYIPILLLFVSLVYGMENKGNILFWFIVLASWGTDMFAYFVGKTIGKHKFSKISPNKTIEGCIGGTIGSTLLMLIYAFICNKYFGMNLMYMQVILMSVVLSLIGQLGDFAASSIKRTVNIKDYSNLIPGHGGMLDRIDSVIFIAPFAYIFFSMVL